MMKKAKKKAKGARSVRKTKKARGPSKKKIKKMMKKAIKKADKKADRKADKKGKAKGKAKAKRKIMKLKKHQSSKTAHAKAMKPNIAKNGKAAAPALTAAGVRRIVREEFNAHRTGKSLKKMKKAAAKKVAKKK